MNLYFELLKKYNLTTCFKLFFIYIYIYIFLFILYLIYLITYAYFLFLLNNSKLIFNSKHDYIIDAFHEKQLCKDMHQLA